jgi:threonine dehydratase
MGNLPDTMENAILDHIHGVATLTIATPLKCRLMTANGTDSTLGTEVTGGTYTAQTIVLTSGSGGTASNTALLTYTLLPACTVVGVEIWDSSGTPKRVWYLPLASNKTYQAGDTHTFAAGAVVLNLD